jgi:uncharacterized surface protein with fasciclin (FAS1) repeats
MKMNLIIYKRVLFIAMALLTVFGGCKKLPLQKNYEFSGEAVDPHVNMTAWAFMQSRPDVFSLMTDAVKYADMVSFYEQMDVKYTYLFINNTGMAAFIAKYGVLTVQNIDVEKVKKMLRYHIIQGEYHSYDKKLPVEPIYVKTLLTGEDGLLTIKVNKSAAGSIGSPIANGNIVLNLLNSNFLSVSSSSVTSNLMPLNGVIHVFPSVAYYRRDANYASAF